MTLFFELVLRFVISLVVVIAYLPFRLMKFFNLKANRSSKTLWEVLKQDWVSTLRKMP